MKTALRQFGWLLLAVSCAAAQTAPATLKGVKVTESGDSLQFDVSLSDSVEPSVLVTTNPDRLVLDFPNTTAAAKQERIAVHQGGIRDVRFGLHASQPLVTRLVVDLEEAHPYEIHREGTHIHLTVAESAPLAARERHVPPPAGRGGLLVTLGRKPPRSRTPEVRDVASHSNAEVLIERRPIDSSVPLAVEAPSSHGSVQGGEVFPGTGTAAEVPPASRQGSIATEVFHPPDQIPSTTVTISSGQAGVPGTQGASVDFSAQKPTEVADATPATAPLSTSDNSSPAPAEVSVAIAPATDPNLKTVFKVKFVANGVAYLDGGRGAGLAEGMKLEIKDTDLPVQQGVAVNRNDPRVVAELEVAAVAETSAVTDIHSPKRAVKEGDLAYLSEGDTQALIQQRTLSSTREYPVVIAFSEGDPLDEEVRKQVPRPPQPSVNRARGRVGFDYMGTVSHGTPSSTNSDVGMVLRADITRIGGTYWNLSGYWRGRLHASSAAAQPTLQDLINRTYHLGMFYDNPNSRLFIGAGRLYLPWAPSLDTIDGGYFGVKLGHGARAGFFAGSTPDPASWNYNPDRRLAGTFINFEGGDYDRFHYTSTSGLGISALKWQIDRPFVFFENTLSYKRFFSIYDSFQADSPRGNPAVPAPGPGISRNFLTVRWQVHPRIELDFNHNYLRDVPTYDPALVGTGLLDQYLFQGASAGARIEVLKRVFVYTNLGSSNRSGDAKNSLNQLYGLTVAHLPWWGLRADAHYSRFNSSFANGSYRSVSFGRNVTDSLRLDVSGGRSNLHFLVGHQRPHPLHKREYRNLVWTALFHR